jgi:hypothetical protein
MIPQNVCQCLCLITIPVDHSIGPVDQVRSKKPWSCRKGVKTSVNRLILNYRRTLVLHYLLQSRGVYTVLLYIFIKQRHVQTFWGIIHVYQAILETGSGPKLSHNHPLPVPMSARITKYLNKNVRRGLCLIYIFSFLFLEPSVSQKNAKKQCAVLPGIFVTVLVSHSNILRYNTCISSYPGDRKWTKIEP